MIFSFQDIADEISALLAGPDVKSVPIRAVDSAAFQKRPEEFVSPEHAAWLAATGWTAKPGSHALLPGAGGIAAVLLALGGEEPTPGASLQIGALPAVLPQGAYALEAFPGSPDDALLAWLMGAYSFRRYLTQEPQKLRRLVVPEGANQAAVLQKAQAIWFARELINLPANDCAPASLADALSDLGQTFGAKVSVIAGGKLLAENFPLLHAVGRASDREPCLADLTWGDPGHPKVTLVGKGICFDTGGLDIKPSQSMALMKKDMAGAASVMALGAMIMAANLPVRLRVIIPAADNNISGNAFRPGDIIKSRAGITVEIANTDAEGRLVLADALALADEETPDLLIDMATLTGAARDRARPRSSAVLHRGRQPRGKPLRGRPACGGPTLAHAALGALRRLPQEQGRRRQSHLQRPLRGLHHGRIIPQTLREERHALRSSGYFRLDAPRRARQTRRRRAAGDTRFI